MAVTIEIIPIPIGSQFVQTIGTDDPDDLNDFRVRLVLDGNGSGLEESDITLPTGASLVSLTGDGVTREAVIRPPTTAGMLTITVAANAFSEGNTETSKDIRISTTFPDADAETPTELFSVDQRTMKGIAVTPTRILLSRTGIGTTNTYFYTHSGTEQTSEQMNLSTGGQGRLDAFNDGFLLCNSDGFYQRYAIGNTTPIETYGLHRSNSMIHTRLGIIGINGNGSLPTLLLPYGKTEEVDRIELNVIGDFFAVAHQNDLLYFAEEGNSGYYALGRVTDDDNVELMKHLNIDTVRVFSQFRDIAIYRDTLYSFEGTEGTNSTGAVYTLDIRKYRPLDLNTKTTIYPVFANEGDTLDLTQYSPDAERIVPDVGFDKPDYLTFNTSNELEIASNAVAETTPVLVKLTGINYIDSIDFQFYLIIVQASNPTVRDVDDLAMFANTTFDLFDIVENATSITFRTGQTQPTGSSISGGVFTIGTAGGTAYFTRRTQTVARTLR